MTVHNHNDGKRLRGSRLRLVVTQMLRMRLLCLGIALLAVGCSSPPAATTWPTATKEDPERQLYDSFRSARYQIDVAGDQLANAVEAAQGLSKDQAEETRQALLDISAGLSQAGSKIGDYADELPAYEAFKAKFAEYDDERLKAIEACNEALKEVKEATDTTNDLLASEPPEREKKVLTSIAAAVSEAKDALDDAVKGMQGQAEE